MLKKVLVANRGEVAVRILRACRELGLQTVSVYSDADRSALHVRYADESYLLGPAPPRESYLSIERLVEIARRSGADAVHPGYGFLAENAGFAHACREAGLIFVGPRPEVIERMGDKVAAREVVQAAGIPVAPGTGPGLDDAELEAAAQSIGYPLLVKATAGGGGKGMRCVHSPAELPAAIAAARSEAEAAFGDGNVYLEGIISFPHRMQAARSAYSSSGCTSASAKIGMGTKMHHGLVGQPAVLWPEKDTRRGDGDSSGIERSLF